MELDDSFVSKYSFFSIVLNGTCLLMLKGRARNWVLLLIHRHQTSTNCVASLVRNFCRRVADDVPPCETSPAIKSEEKRMFSQAKDIIDSA